jgi:hypothetical protein
MFAFANGMRTFDALSDIQAPHFSKFNCRAQI